MTGARPHVDADLCELHGLCAGIAPRVFELGDEVAVVTAEPDDDVERAAVADAVAMCPANAIALG